MSRMRDLLIKRRSEVTPLIHWDFSGKSNADAGTIVEDLTGNGYDLELKNFAFDNESGYNGYPQDLRKTSKNSNFIYQSENTITFTRHTDAFSFYIYKANYNNISYVMRVHLPDGVEAVILSAYVGPNYADYGLSKDRETFTFYEGINIVPAFSSEFFDNCSYVGYAISEINTDKEATIEIFPLYPDQLVFNNNLAQSIKPVKIDIKRGFTAIIRRKFIQDNIKTAVLGQIGAMTGDTSLGSDYFIRDYLSEKNALWSAYNFGQATTVPIPSGDLMWTTLAKFFNGQVTNLRSPGVESPNDKPILLGSYITSNSFGNFTIKEVYIFDRNLTQSQIEKFISDNMIPLPEVYYDVEKQGTLNEHTTKDKLIDFSGNEHHGTLHNFTFLSPGDEGYYSDFINGFIKGNQGEWNKPYLTLNKTDPSYGATHTVLVSAPNTATEDMEVTTPVVKLRVHKVEGCTMACCPKIDGDSGIPAGTTPVTITSPGDYTVPSQTFLVPAGKTYYPFTAIVSDGDQADILVEVLGKGDGWGYQRTADAFKFQDTYHLQGSDTSGEMYAVSKSVSKSNFTAPIVVPKYKIKVTGLTEIRNSDDRAYISTGYDIVYTDSTSEVIRWKEIIEDGEYEIDTYALSPSYIDRYDEILFVRPIAITYRYIPTENNVTVEFLPDYGDCLRFNKDLSTYCQFNLGDEILKTVFMVVDHKGETGTSLYDQRIVAGDSRHFEISTNNSYVAYNNGGVFDGITYINGELNTDKKSSDLIDKHTLTCVCQDANPETASSQPFIGRSIVLEETKSLNYNTNMKLYKFLGFKEALSEKQIKMVIEKYGLQVD